ncbi:MAG: glycosyltransferase [Oligoflexales bacterium]
MVPEKQKGDEFRSLVVFWDSFGFEQKHSGINRYARSLMDGLKFHGIEPILLGSKLSLSSNTLDVGPQNWLEKQLVKAKIVWPTTSFLKLLKKESFFPTEDKKKIYHGLANINLPIALSKSSGFSYVLTIHDLIPLLPDSGVSKIYKAQFSYMLPRSIEYSDLVICVSQWTFDLVLERFPRAKSKVVLLPHGIPPSSKKNKLNVQAKQLLFISRWEPYKGFELINSLLENLPIEYFLVVVTDKKGEQYLNQFAASQMLANRLKVYISIPDAELDRIYETSSLYLHFSRYEGFGLPVWEALNRGTPALYYKGHACDSLNNSRVALGMEQNCAVEAWVDAIESWSKCKTNIEYQKLLSEFLKKQPTWNDTAEKVKALYNSLI